MKLIESITRQSDGAKLGGHLVGEDDPARMQRHAGDAQPLGGEGVAGPREVIGGARGVEDAAGRRPRRQADRPAVGTLFEVAPQVVAEAVETWTGDAKAQSLGPGKGVGGRRGERNDQHHRHAGEGGAEQVAGSLTVTFTVAGTYMYHCQFHPGWMRGTIIVKSG